MRDILAVLVVVVVGRHQQLGEHVEGAIARGHVDRLDLDVVDADGSLDDAYTISACIKEGSEQMRCRSVTG